MQSILNLVRGSVSTKDFVPVLQCFHIYNGRIQGQNGRIAIDAPFPDMGDITVPAERFLKAVDACDGEPKISVTEEGKLSIKKGAFRAVLPLHDHTAFPRAEKTGEVLATCDGLIAMLRRLRPFISEDASRPWALGILLRADYAYATNNVILARTPFEWSFGDIILPVYAIDELLRIGEEPTVVLVDDTALTFEYKSGAWLRAQLLTGGWPAVENKFDDIPQLEPVPDGLREAVEKVLPFCPDPKFPLIALSANGVSTAEGEHMAAVEGIVLPEGRYRAETLLAVLEVAKRISLEDYPRPVMFSGDQIEGMFVGMKT
jgi:DNA polymerase III sliding clamp (beta) subunit (PCNA family)